MSTCNRVEELDGPYGPFAIGERAIQRLWASGEIINPLYSTNKNSISILSPGNWNRGSGPDFLGAEILVNHERRRGDIEIHLRCSDWEAHGHQHNPAFANVILHAVLLPGVREVMTPSGTNPETVVLLPYLPRDLEDIAEEDALLELRGRAGEVARKVRESEKDLHHGLKRRALERLKNKTKYAQARLKENGWNQALHEMVFESLGLGGNRAPMSELAHTYPPEQMTLLGVDAIYLKKSGRWRLRGLRPAGHPYRRIAQYLELNRRQPLWREQIKDWANDLPSMPLPSMRRQLIDDILGRVFPDGRADTLCLNAIMPLIEAMGKSIEQQWFDWPPGNHPEDIQEARRVLGLTGATQNYEIQGILDVIRRSYPPIEKN
jgi:hypothetical protein